MAPLKEIAEIWEILKEERNIILSGVFDLFSNHLER